jgi:hypothetical protein
MWLPAYRLGCALLLANVSLSCASAGPNGGMDPLAVHGLKACTESPLAGRGAPSPDSIPTTTASLLADTQPDVFGGVWWDGVAGQIVFGTIDVSVATVMIDAGLPAGTPYRVEHVPRSFAELRVLMDRAMSVEVPGPFRSVAPRGWDGTVDVGVPALDDAVLSAIAEEFADDRDAICVSVGGPAST